MGCEYCGMPPSGEGDGCCKAFALDCCRAALSRLQKQLATQAAALEKAGLVCDAAQAFDDLCSWKLTPEDREDGLMTPGYPLGEGARVALNRMHDALLAQAEKPQPKE